MPKMVGKAEKAAGPELSTGVVLTRRRAAAHAWPRCPPGLLQRGWGGRRGMAGLTWRSAGVWGGCGGLREGDSWSWRRLEAAGQALCSQGFGEVLRGGEARGVWEQSKAKPPLSQPGA